MMPTRTNLRKPPARRLALAVGLIVFFAGLSALGLWDGFVPSPQGSRSASAASPENPSFQPTGHAPQTWYSQPEPEHALAGNAAVVPSAERAVPLSSQVSQGEKPVAGQEVALETAPQTPSPPPPVQPKELPAKEGLSWTPLIGRLASDGFDAPEMEKLFASLESPPLPEFMAQKAIELYGRYGKATLNVSDEERVKFAPPDYSRLAGGMTVATGRRVMNANRAFFESLYKRFGVPAPFIVAVMMVETGLGAEVGKQSALLALGSMAVANDLDLVLPVISGMDPDKENLRELVQARSDWAYDELKALLHYAKASGKDAATIPGSVFGAIGICQFMPSNIPLYAVSTNKKRPTPDLFTLADAAASVASYLSAHGWKKAQTPSAQIAVLRSYNHSDVYASTVYGVATALISPTTHQGAEAARKGGNAVTAARETARASIPSGSKKVKPLETLPNYSDLLTIGNEKR